MDKQPFKLTAFWRVFLSEIYPATLLASFGLTIFCVILFTPMLAILLGFGWLTLGWSNYLWLILFTYVVVLLGLLSEAFVRSGGLRGLKCKLFRAFE